MYLELTNNSANNSNMKKVLIRKRIRNLKKAFNLFVELVETIPLMYNIKYLG